MPKVKIETFLKSSDGDEQKSLNGILKEDEIVYKDGCIKTTIKFQDNLMIVRENEDYKFEFVYIDGKCSTGKYVLKLYNMSMDVKIFTSLLEIKKNIIKLVYSLSMDGEDCGMFDFELKYETI